MATPDVRVRLSAEGVSEVVDALKRIQAEAKATGKSAEHIGLLGNALESLKELLPAIGLAVAVEKMFELGKGAIESADHIGKLAQETGATAEQLSVLSYAAQLADVDQEHLDKGLLHLAKTMNAAASGAAEPTDALKRLGLTLNDVKGLNAGDQFVLIAQKLGSITSSSAKAAVAQQLFGLSGAKLIPLMNDLANGGFEEARKKAEALGLVMSKDLTDAAQQVNDAFKTTAQIAKGLAIEFVSGFIPQITAALETLNESVTDGSGTSWLKTIGEFAGFVIRFVVTQFVEMGKDIGAIFAQIEVVGIGTWDAIKKAATGDFAGAKSAFAQGLEQAKAIEDFNNEEINKLEEGLNNPLKPKAAAAAKPERTGDLGDAKNPELQKLIDARAALLKAQAANELTLTKARIKVQEDAEKRGYDDGLISLTDYFAKRKSDIEKLADAEQKTLKTQLAIAQQTPTKDGDSAAAAKKQQEIAALRTQLAALDIQKQGELAALDYEKKQAETKSLEDRLNLESQLADKQGNRYQAALLALDEELLKTDELMRKQGMSEDARKQALDDIRSRGQGKAQFEADNTQGTAAFTDIDAKRQSLQDQVNSGNLFQLQADQQLIDYEKKRLAGLRDIAAAMTDSAAQSKDPALIESARQFTEQVDQLGIATDRSGQAMADFKKTAQDALTGGLTDFFVNLTKGAMTFGEAVRSLAATVVDALAKIAAQELALNISKSVFTFFGNTPAAATGGYLSNGQILRRSAGGTITGPGSGTSDGVLMYGSNGEFVTRAAVLQEPGALDFAHAFNRHGMAALRSYARAPRYAEGGLVGTPGKAAAGGDIGLQVGLEDGLVIKHLETPEGQRSMIKILANNKRGVRGALGIG